MADIPLGQRRAVPTSRHCLFSIPCVYMTHTGGEEKHGLMSQASRKVETSKSEGLDGAGGSGHSSPGHTCEVCWGESAQGAGVLVRRSKSPAPNWSWRHRFGEGAWNTGVSGRGTWAGARGVSGSFGTTPQQGSECLPEGRETEGGLGVAWGLVGAHQSHTLLL